MGHQPSSRPANRPSPAIPLPHHRHPPPRRLHPPASTSISSSITATAAIHTGSPARLGYSTTGNAPRAASIPPPSKLPVAGEKAAAGVGTRNKQVSYLVLDRSACPFSLGIRLDLGSRSNRFSACALRFLRAILNLVRDRFRL